MPNFDKSGPAGEGPLTGRGQGACAQKEGVSQNALQRGLGRMFGSGCGRGIGRGRRCERNACLSLDEQEKMLEERLQAIRNLKKGDNSEQ